MVNIVSEGTGELSSYHDRVTLPSIKPRLRGVLHQYACIAAAVAGATLVAMAPTPRAVVAAAVYGLSLVLMFGVSAFYHRPTWRPNARRWLRRLDHSMIFLVFAGTFTPFCVLALRSQGGGTLLVIAWVAAGLGIVKSLLWVGSPRVVTASLYVVFGMLVLPYMPALARAVGPVGIALVVAGAACNLAGAVVYAFKRPNPAPTVFGYHEIFHALVVVGCGFLFAEVAMLTGADGMG